MSRYYRSFLEESGPSYTARTTAFASATGITDLTILNALNTFDLGLISNGLDTKMKALYPFVGGNATTHKYNFMDARDLDVAFRLEFNGGFVHSNTGCLPNGINGYANTFLTPSLSLLSNNTHMSIYSRTNVAATQIEIGCSVSSSVDIRMVIHTKWSDGNFYGDMYNQSSGGRITYAMGATPSTGLFNLNRTSSSLSNAWRNSVKLATNTTAISTPLPTLPIFIFNYNNGGSPSAFYLNRELAFSSIGDGLTDTEASNLYTLVQAMQISLSRQV